MPFIIYYNDTTDPANPNAVAREFEDQEEAMVFSNLVGTNLIRIETTGVDAPPEPEPLDPSITG